MRRNASPHARQCRRERSDRCAPTRAAECSEHSVVAVPRWEVNEAHASAISRHVRKLAFGLGNGGIDLVVSEVGLRMCTASREQFRAPDTKPSHDGLPNVGEHDVLDPGVASRDRRSK